MHIVKRTEESVSNKSVTETHLRTESSTSDFAASCCTAQWLQSGLGAEYTMATQHHVAQRKGYQSGFGGSNDFVRTVATAQAGAEISSAQWLLRKLEQ